jgi:hypothetical protein
MKIRERLKVSAGEGLREAVLSGARYRCRIRVALRQPPWRIWMIFWRDPIRAANHDSACCGQSRTGGS